LAAVQKFSSPRWRFGRKFQLLPVVGEASLTAGRALRGWFGKWLESLREMLDPRSAGFPPDRAKTTV
jgi:hypothetical protein